MTLDSAGRILLAGSYDNADGSDVAIARLLSDGSPDPSFGTQGRVQVPLMPGVTHINQADSIIALPNDRIVVGANVNNQGGVTIGLAANGTLDPRFGADGIYTQPQATPGVRSHRQVLAGDYLYWAGDSLGAGGHSDFAAMRAVVPLFADDFDLE